MAKWIAARLAEPSTWYGLGVICAGAFSHLFPAEWTAFWSGVQYVSGGLAIITHERG